MFYHLTIVSPPSLKRLSIVSGVTLKRLRSSHSRRTPVNAAVSLSVS